MEPTPLASLGRIREAKTMRRAAFLDVMATEITWERLSELIEPIYREAASDPRQQPLDRMLRIRFMQIWFNLSDPQTEEALYDIESMRRFAGIKLPADDVPDESTILCFRCLLEEHNLSEEICDVALLAFNKRKALLKSASLVDAPTVEVSLMREAGPMRRCEVARKPGYSGAERGDRADQESLRTGFEGVSMRPATPMDAGIIREIIVELAAHHECLGEATITEGDIVADFFPPLSRINAVVAEDDAGVCGLITWHYSYSTYRGRLRIHAEDCYVSSRRRSMGLGKALMSYLAYLAIAQGCEAVTWITLISNNRAVDMLESLGALRVRQFEPWRWEGESLFQAHLRFQAAQGESQTTDF